MLANPPRMKAVFLVANANKAKAVREDISLKTPIMTEANKGSKLIPALSKKGAV